MRDKGNTVFQSETGFTLLEVLLAITITGFVLAAATTLVVSVSDIWIDRQDAHFFEDHVDGVTEFVQSCFIEASVEIALENAPSTGTGNTSSGGSEREGEPEDSPSAEIIAGDSDPESSESTTPNTTNRSQESIALIRASEKPVEWARPPGFSNFRDPLLNFKLRKQPPLLVNQDDSPALGVDTFLYFEAKEGLSLLWFSTLQEEAEDENDLRRTQISPHVQALRYIYWDESFERWEEEEEPKEGEKDDFITPRYIKLVFEYEGVTKERTLAIPVASESALLF
ncbi:MAG: prepilin-type N-terminal cleavage/methylation domain-containing protein [Verrucomicrobiota bacterium]